MPDPQQMPALDAPATDWAAWAERMRFDVRQAGESVHAFGESIRAAQRAVHRRHHSYRQEFLQTLAARIIRDRTS